MGNAPPEDEDDFQRKLAAQVEAGAEGSKVSAFRIFAEQLLDLRLDLFCIWVCLLVRPPFSGWLNGEPKGKSPLWGFPYSLTDNHIWRLAEGCLCIYQPGSYGEPQEGMRCCALRLRVFRLVLWPHSPGVSHRHKFPSDFIWLNYPTTPLELVGPLLLKGAIGYLARSDRKPGEITMICPVSVQSPGLPHFDIPTRSPL